MDARQIILEPVVSEKSYALMADGKLYPLHLAISREWKCVENR